MRGFSAVCLFLFFVPLVLGQSTVSHHATWRATLNEGELPYSTHYCENAVKVTPEGYAFTDSATVRDALFVEGLIGGMVDTVTTLYTATAGGKGEFRYQIGQFALGKDRRRYAQLLILRVDSGGVRRELEFLAPYADERGSTDEVDAARTGWMKACNDHAVERLINEYYTVHTAYYNHRPLIRGRAALIEEYGYMRNPSYQLELRPLHLEMVSEDLALEIGQCVGSYGGKYVIVWQREQDGKWRVLLDSNV